jgi:hypothetical protein
MQRNDRRAAQLGTSLAPHGAGRDLEDGSHVREARPAIVLRAKMGPGAPRFDTRCACVTCYGLTVSRFRSARSSSRALLVA